LRANVPTLTVSQATVARIDVGQVAIGPATIERLIVRNMRFAMSAGAGRLRDFHVTVTLTISLSWRVHVDLVFTDFTREGTWQIGRPSSGFGFNDVPLPGLNSLTVNLDEMTAQNLSASSGPIANLGLGPIIAEQIRGATIAAPTAGFAVNGIGLTAVRGEGVVLPAASVGEVSIARLTGGSVPIPTLSIPNLAFPAASVGEIRSSNVNVNAVAPAVVFNAGGGLLRVTLRVVPEANVRIAQMVLTNINASTSIGSVEVRNVVLPFEVLNLRLSDIGIDTIEIPAFEVV
jgi:hypothetical protein